MLLPGCGAKQAAQTYVLYGAATAAGIQPHIMLSQIEKRRAYSPLLGLPLLLTHAHQAPRMPPRTCSYCVISCRQASSPRSASMALASPSCSSCIASYASRICISRWEGAEAACCALEGTLGFPTQHAQRPDTDNFKF